MLILPVLQHSILILLFFFFISFERFHTDIAVYPYGLAGLRYLYNA